MNTITPLRNEKKLFPTAWLSPDPLEAGHEARAILDAWRNKLQRSDVLQCTGSVHFGSTHTLDLPACIYRGYARWLTGCKIDFTTVNGVQTKPSSTCGFSIVGFARFEHFYLGGTCCDPTEDGGLIGFAGKGAGAVEFVDSEVDASQGMDWGIYSWFNGSRKVTFTRGVLRFCRFGVSLAASGGGADQQVLLDGVELVGNANGSHSYGESSGAGEKGGVLTAVLNRAGSTVVRNCRANVVGLEKPYNSKWGCPRIAALATNNYYAASGATTFQVENNTVQITPGVASVVGETDVIAPGKLTLVELGPQKGPSSVERIQAQTRQVAAELALSS